MRNNLTGAATQLPCAAVFAFIGAEPAAEWLPAEIARDAKGFVLTGTDVIASGLWPRSDRERCPLETSVPGVLAAGDIRTGSVKRVGFAVGDGSLAVTWPIDWYPSTTESKLKAPGSDGFSSQI